MAWAVVCAVASSSILAQPPLAPVDNLLANYQLLLDYVAAQANARSGAAEGYGVTVTGHRIITLEDGALAADIVTRKLSPNSSSDAANTGTWLRARGQLVQEFDYSSGTCARIMHVASHHYELVLTCLCACLLHDFI